MSKFYYLAVFWCLATISCLKPLFKVSTSEKADKTQPLTQPLAQPLAAVSLKLAPFWLQDPALWCSQVEAQFETRGITSQATKYGSVIASLSPEFGQEIRDLLLNPPKRISMTASRMSLLKGPLNLSKRVCTNS